MEGGPTGADALGLFGIARIGDCRRRKTPFASGVCAVSGTCGGRTRASHVSRREYLLSRQMSQHDMTSFLVYLLESNVAGNVALCPAL